MQGSTPAADWPELEREIISQMDELRVLQEGEMLQLGEDQQNERDMVVNAHQRDHPGDGPMQGGQRGL